MIIRVQINIYPNQIRKVSMDIRHICSGTNFVLEKNFWAERAKKILILSCLNEKVGGELTSITRWRCLLLIPISYIVVFVERDRRDNS